MRTQVGSPASTFKTNKIKSDVVARALDYYTREAKTGGCLGLDGRPHQLIQWAPTSVKPWLQKEGEFLRRIPDVDICLPRAHKFPAPTQVDTPHYLSIMSEKLMVQLVKCCSWRPRFNPQISTRKKARHSCSNCFVCFWFFIVVILDKSLFSPDCLGTGSVDQAGLEVRDLPASAW